MLKSFPIWLPLEDLGQLEERAYKPSSPIKRVADSTQDRAKVEWVVCATQGGTVTLSTGHERAGFVSTLVNLTMPK